MHDIVLKVSSRYWKAKILGYCSFPTLTEQDGDAGHTPSRLSLSLAVLEPVWPSVMGSCCGEKIIRDAADARTNWRCFNLLFNSAFTAK